MADTPPAVKVTKLSCALVAAVAKNAKTRAIAARGIVRPADGYVAAVMFTVCCCCFVYYCVKRSVYTQSMLVW